MNYKVALIANPYSFRFNFFKRNFYKIYKNLNKIGKVEYFESEGKKSRITFVKDLIDKEGFDIIVAAGGDGFLNEIANGVMKSNRHREVKIGFIPTGISNVFALEANIPRNMVKASQMISLLYENPIKIDVGVLNGRIFLLMASAGIDALGVHKFNPKLKKIMSKFGYVYAAVKNFFEKPHYPIKVIIETKNGKKLKIMATTIIITNASFYGGRMKSVKNANWFDGYLDACIFTKTEIVDYLRYISGFIIGIHNRFPDVVFVKTKKIELLGESIPIQIDGEPYGRIPATVSIKEKTLNIIAPSFKPKFLKEIIKTIFDHTFAVMSEKIVQTIFLKRKS